VVRGFVVAVDAEIIVRSSAVLLRPIRLVGGHLELERGAVLPASIELFGARLTRPDQSTVAAPPNGRVELSIGQTQVSLSASELDAAQHALMKAVLPFDRFVPKNTAGIEAVAQLDPGLGMLLERSVPAPRELVIGSVFKLSFISDKVVAARQSGWAGPRGRALLAAVELKDPESAVALWDAVAAIPECARGSARARIGSSPTTIARCSCGPAIAGSSRSRPASTPTRSRWPNRPNSPSKSAMRCGARWSKHHEPTSPHRRPCYL
jgi:hypothetical protein